MIKIKVIFILLLTAGQLYSQTVAEAIKKTAIECKELPSLDQNIYDVLKEYKFICLGEMHGTKEPAEFLIGLAKIFISNKRTVIIGLEIPGNLMEQFNKEPDSIGLSKTTFFSEKSVDGRASESWFQAINQCNKLGIKFCFFDNSDSNRDLGMYKKLIECYRSDSNSVVLTLTGNIHNKIRSFNGSKTMGCFLKERFGNKVCSINHIYNGGTMYNKTSQGLKVHTVEPAQSVFSTATNYENYYLPNIFNIEDYSGFFYTRTVTASFPMTK